MHERDDPGDGDEGNDEARELHTDDYGERDGHGENPERRREIPPQSAEGVAPAASDTASGATATGGDAAAAADSAAGATAQTGDNAQKGGDNE